jgi:hypothetical protein
MSPGRRYGVMLTARRMFTVYIQIISDQQSITRNEVARVLKIDYACLAIKTLHR